MEIWKPKKKNLYNNRFMGYMKERNKRISDSSKCFSYVVVKGPPLYNKKGRKKLYRVGDFMEYADIAKEQNMKIDINYYLEMITAMCTCFINEDDSYQLSLLNRIIQIKDSDKRKKQIDIYFQKKAKKYLEKYIKSLQ